MSDITAIQATTWNRSTNSWNPPATLIEDSGERFTNNDKVSVTGDWTRAG